MIRSAGVFTGSATSHDDVLARPFWVPGSDVRQLPQRWGCNRASRHTDAAALRVGAAPLGPPGLHSFGPRLRHGLVAVVLLIIGYEAPLIDDGVAPTGTVPTGLSSFDLTVDSTPVGS